MDTEAATGDILLKKCVLTKFPKFYRKAPVLESIFNRVAGLRATTLLKRDSNTSVFLWNLRIFKNTYFEEHLRTTASPDVSNGERLSIERRTGNWDENGKCGMGNGNGEWKQGMEMEMKTLIWLEKSFCSLKIVF